jgi:hypothetical protein
LIDGQCAIARGLGDTATDAIKIMSPAMESTETWLSKTSSIRTGRLLDHDCAALDANVEAW